MMRDLEVRRSFKLYRADEDDDGDNAAQDDADYSYTMQ